MLDCSRKYDTSMKKCVSMVSNTARSTFDQNLDSCSIKVSFQLHPDDDGGSKRSPRGTGRPCSSVLCPRLAYTRAQHLCVGAAHVHEQK
mmetsp:Transcript_14559/g.38471  ORF Transcript_14559/g.38471 Transcript_14559/m.38471 type:complete len:89 (-) Transcript_14559:631-897(-)